MSDIPQNKSSIFQELLIILIMIIPAIYLLLIWDKLPDEVPMHWNFQGEIDRYGSKESLWMIILLLNIPIYLLMLFLPKISPKPENLELMGKKYPRLRLILQLFLSSIIAVIIFSASGNNSIGIETLLGGCLAGFMILFGNYMGSIRQNHFMGIRTPWTLENAEIWKKTHQLAGKYWVIGGIIGLILLFVLPQNWALTSIVVLMISPLIFTAGYSFWLFQKLKKG